MQRMTMTAIPRSAQAVTALVLAVCAVPQSAGAGGVFGSDANACTSGHGPAIQVNMLDLRDRQGQVKLELYPDNVADFMRSDTDLLAAGKVFRRVTVDTPGSGLVSLCIRVPHPGRYALLVLHSRRAQDKFDFFADGIGLRSNSRIGRSRPSVDAAAVAVGAGVLSLDIHTQYLRGLSGFSPLR